MLPEYTTTPVSHEDAGVVSFARQQHFAFPAAARVRSKAVFAQVFQSGKRTAAPAFALHWLTDTQAARLGFAVSRKVDARAVKRNYIKRALREAFRHLRPHLKPGAYVVVARPAAAKMESWQLQFAFEQLLQRADTLPRPAAGGTMLPFKPRLSHAAPVASVAPQTTSAQ